MGVLTDAWAALSVGGPMVYPLLAIGALAMVIILDRGILYYKCLSFPETLAERIEDHKFTWDELERELDALGPRNAFARILKTVAHHRNRPTWWIESRSADEAGRIDATLTRGLWVLETVVTGAPLLGLLGTITGMMEAFKIIGANGVVAPAKVTAGVAEALVATALGLLIAIIALFAFNFFERMRSAALDRMEQLGSRLVDHVRLNREAQGNQHEAA